jgi:radical SAM protein with 4Fe4S-binding SPASM domain
MHSFEKDDPAMHLEYIRRVAAFADAAAAAGIIVVLRFWNNGCEEEKNATALAGLRQLLPGDWTENSRGIRIRDRLFIEWGERFRWPDKDAPIQGEKYFCYGLRDHFGILCDGTVVPCCLDSEGGIPLGNIHSQDIETILSSPRAKAMVEGFSCQRATEELCRRCGYAQRFV